MRKFLVIIVSVLCLPYYALGLCEQEQTILSSNSFLTSIFDRLNCYNRRNMEVLAEAVGGTIPYRGSDTINIMGNSIICCGIEDGISVASFTQVDNNFPIDWSDEICIGMNYFELRRVFEKYGVAESFNDSKPNSFYVEDIDGDVITCVEYNGFDEDESDKSLSIVFIFSEEKVTRISLTINRTNE